MSYILEALKKADQQRELGKVPGIDASHESGKTTASRAPWIIAAVLLMNVVVLLAVLLWPEDRDDNDSASNVAAGPPERPVAVQRDIAPAPTTVTPQQRPRTLKPIPRPVPEPARVVQSEPESVPREIDPDAARLALARSLLPPGAEDEPVVATQPEPVESFAEQPVRQITQPAEPELPVWPRISQNLFNQLSGGLRLDVHVFTDEPQGRFVLINMRKYYEGQRLQEGPVLDEITPEGVILSFRGQRFRVRAQ
jgi:general secretion pathway protein B